MTFYYKRAAKALVGGSCLLFIHLSGSTLSPETHTGWCLTCVNCDVSSEIAKVSIFIDNDLIHITDDHFEIKLIARLLNQIYVIQPPMLPPRYEDAPPGEYGYSETSTSIGSTTPSAPQFSEHLHSLLTHS